METIKVNAEKSKFHLEGYTYFMVRKFKKHVKWKCLKSDGKYNCSGVLHTSLKMDNPVIKHEHNHAPKLKGEIKCFKKNQNLKPKQTYGFTSRRDTPSQICIPQQLRNSPTLEDKSLEEMFERLTQTDPDLNYSNNIPQTIAKLTNNGKYIIKITLV